MKEGGVVRHVSRASARQGIISKFIFIYETGKG